MRKFSFLVGCMQLLCSYLSGQSLSVKGGVTDTTGKTPLHNAVIYLKDTADSSLVSFTRADAKGNFLLQSPKAGAFVIVVSYPGYVSWVDTIHLNGTAAITVPIALNTKEHILEEVIVRGTVPPIRIKGDTTEYIADSFRVKPGATVEELLRIMPGISVNSKGEITKQGQTVQKVLVDGDEFFGDDPTMATKNLNAKDVAKVQVFDRKSDQATLTGIDDGVTQKTVNLVLKDNAKKGYFGQVEAGTDLDKYYQSKSKLQPFYQFPESR